MNNLLKLVLVLFLICLIAGVLLATVNMVTEAPIREAARMEKLAAIEKVLPAHDNQPDSDTVEIQQDGQTWTFCIGRKAGEFAGAAFEAISTRGYGGDIVVMVGINTEDNVQAIEILQQKETPGLGAKIKDKEFKGGFLDRSLKNIKWAVLKDGGDIDQITAATISSRAVVNAVKQGIDIYLANEKEIKEGKTDR